MRQTVFDRNWPHVVVVVIDRDKSRRRSVNDPQLSNYMYDNIKYKALIFRNDRYNVHITI